MDLTTEVRKLREHIGESQQAFATRLGLSISAVQNYERDRTPTGRALQMLAKAAIDAGRHDLAKPFTVALGRELNLGANEGVMLSSEWKDEKTLSTYALIDVRRTELYGFLLALHETIGRYLNPKDDDVKARAEKLLADFERSARKAWKGTRGSVLGGIVDETSLVEKERL